MKKCLAVIGAALLLFAGCTSLSDEKAAPPAITTLVLALPEGASRRLEETARELIRRGEDFSQNTLAFELVYEKDIAQAMEKGTAHIYIAENAAAAQTWEKLNALELPYLFYNADHMVSGVNAPEFLKSLNKVAGLPVELRRVAFGGYIDMAGTLLQGEKEERTEPVLLALSQGFFTQQAQEILEITQVTPLEGQTPLSVVHRGEAELGEVQADDVLLKSLEGQTLFFTQHRMVLVDIFFASNMDEILPLREQAALEEATVYAAGYCKTMADEARKQTAAKAHETGAAGRSPNINNLFSRFGDLYSAQGRRAAPAYDKDLAKLLRQYGIKN